MNAKPHFTLVANRPVQVERRETPIEAARRRFGKAFAHESGATWKPRTTPLLIEWLQTKGKA